MRRLLTVLSLLFPIVLPAAVSAQEHQAQLQGFGGFTVRGSSTQPLFGASIAVPVTDNIHVLVEAARFNDIMSPTIATLLDLTPVDIRLSAYYGEAGIRIIGGSRRPIRPYVEGTVGYAHLYATFKGAGNKYDPYINAGLQLLGRNHPILGVGAGIQLQGGPVFLDLGYRHHRIQKGNAIESLLTGGNLDVDQVRVGIGVRF
jgi:hypothetical protein